MTAAGIDERHAGTTLSAGILGADLLHLAADLDRLEAAGVRLLHVDVMDGVFCPQMTVGPAFVAALATRFPIDAHLMIDEPLEKVDAYVEAGARIVTFHVEATRHPHRVLQRLAGRGVIRGVALNPGTPVGVIEPLLDELELVLVLSVNPGWAGQTFIPAAAARLAAVRELVADRDILVGIDGGVTRENVSDVAALGTDVVVAGSALFAGGELTANARLLLTATGSARNDGSPDLDGPRDQGGE
jgi:ribulose-phosphate 3-epimerase